MSKAKIVIEPVTCVEGRTVWMWKLIDRYSVFRQSPLFGSAIAAANHAKEVKRLMSEAEIGVQDE